MPCFKTNNISKLAQPRLSRKISITVPGFFRLFPNSARGTSASNSSSREAAVPRAIAEVIEIGALCFTMGRSLREYLHSPFIYVGYMIMIVPLHQLFYTYSRKCIFLSETSLLWPSQPQHPKYTIDYRDRTWKNCIKFNISLIWKNLPFLSLKKKKLQKIIWSLKHENVENMYAKISKCKAFWRRRKKHRITCKNCIQFANTRIQKKILMKPFFSSLFSTNLLK